MGSRISGIKALADAITKLHTAERTAFDLEDKGERDADPLTELLGAMRRSSVPVNPSPADDK